MLKVFKYVVPLEDYFSLVLPRGAKILSVLAQGGKAQMWAMVNPANKTEKRNFRLADTGQQINEDIDNLDFIGTFHVVTGNYVGHLFEIK
jgi:hypothetical protein